MADNRATAGLPGTGLFYTVHDRKRRGRGGAAPAPSVPQRDRLKLVFFQRLMTPAEERRFIDGIQTLNEGDQDAAQKALEDARHPRRHPPIASATAMRMTASPIQTERMRQDRSVRRAEKHRCRAGMMRVHGPIRPTPGVCATTDIAQGERRLFNRQNQANLPSPGRPLAECRVS